jgi:hypothetical protein
MQMTSIIVRIYFGQFQLFLQLLDEKCKKFENNFKRLLTHKLCSLCRKKMDL